MPEPKRKPAKDDSKADDKNTVENEQARVPDDPELRGQSLQDHERITADEKGQTYSEPDRAPAARDKALEEVRRVRAANEERTRLHSTVGIERTIKAQSPSGSEKRPIAIMTADGKMYINTHGESVLDADGIIALVQAGQASFQAVS